MSIRVDGGTLPAGPTRLPAREHGMKALKTRRRASQGRAEAPRASPAGEAIVRKSPAGGIALELPAELIQARRFGLARSARSTAILEDYVELIADLLASTGEARATDIARRLGVSHPTAISTIARLKREALATARPYRGVFLTEKGEALAKRVRARHRLVVNVLIALGVPAEAAEADAEGIEHHVSETTLRAFARFLQSRAGG
jgi:DtxR family transcriptional regulator, manganese transport regulator